MRSIKIYRVINETEALEFYTGGVTPTGRVFRKALENEDLNGKQTIQIPDTLTGKQVVFVYSYNK